MSGKIIAAVTAWPVADRHLLPGDPRQAPASVTGHGILGTLVSV